MNSRVQSYLCIRAVGVAFQLQPADQKDLPSDREYPEDAWYFATTHPLYEFNIFGSFGSYRDLQAAYSAMTLVDPLVEGPM